LPALREKKNDIILLINYFLETYSRNTGKPAKKISKEAADVLIKYDWPGNVRELKNLVERLTTVVNDPVINLKDVSMLTSRKKETLQIMKLKDAISIFEKNFIIEVLEKVRFNKKEAAELLDIHRNTLINKMNELGIKY
jgi:DNA-binding NtrC family response regulator